MASHFQAAARAFVDRFVGGELRRADQLAAFLPSADPFGIDHDCINPDGHVPVDTGNAIICCHCGRIF